ncbi:hypothetical protein DAPPUDRAFT_259824 [Daphnia pulex]|uniref:Uncharacterized protein n=1 Tax=Daphnia pulex TaxID=6669 RepID=E9HHY4_DAPPU|nr:hypothetical protein DAPPUDRAFT_259824 [Daphnia pulex]|eukprot:EFX68659.1 hypothetical protein DAPPUDRAFT_259824 [Daphnia pulex]
MAQYGGYPNIIEMDEETIRDQIGELEERYGACALEELPDYYEEDPLITRPSKEEIILAYPIMGVA